MRLNYLIFNTGLGWVGVIGSEDGLKRLTLPQASPEHVWRVFDESSSKWRDTVVSEAQADYFGDLPDRIRDYLDGKSVSFADKLDLGQATSFQRQVWKTTQSIPYGQTRSYAWIASRVGMPRASRAVGQAMARNPLPIVIPCHRVVGSDGSLVGFGGGTHLKQRLLRIESGAR
jgi:methylated-DNA-[protein]-cysteine S-methyltransferase